MRRNNSASSSSDEGTTSQASTVRQVFPGQSGTRMTRDEALKFVRDRQNPNYDETDVLETLMNRMEFEGNVEDVGDGQANTEETRRERCREFIRNANAVESRPPATSQNLVSYMSDSLDSFLEFLLRKIQMQWRAFIYAILPLQHIQTLILICIVQMISVPTLFSSLPTVAAYLGMAAMVYNNLRMFQMKKLRRRLTRHLPNRRSISVEEDRAMGEFLVDSWEPFVNFLIALLIFVMAVGAGDRKLPNVQLPFGVAMLFAFLCFSALAERFDHYSAIAIGANVVSFLPALMQTMNIAAGRWPIWKPFFQCRIGLINVSIGIPSLSLLVAGLAFVLLAIKARHSDDLLQVIVPHLVCLTWCDVAMTLIFIGWKQFNPTGLIFALVLIFVIVFPSSAGVALLLALAMSQIKTTMLVTKILITAAVFISPFLIQRLVRYLQTKYNISAFIVSSKKRKWLLLAVYVGTLVMATALMFQDNLAIGPDADMTNMTWSQFERHCTVTGANTIKRQEECSELKGMAINWKGSVDSVKIIKIENSFETLLDYLPDSLGQSLRCFYDTNITNIMYQSGMSPNPCSLTSHNVYTFELELSGPYGERVISSNKGHILLTAVHAFREILEAVDEGDVVRFVASFDQYPIYRYPPKLKLLELECVMCKQLMKTKDRSRLRVVGGGRLGSDRLWYRCFHAFKFLFNFIYAPLFRIET